MHVAMARPAMNRAHVLFSCLFLMPALAAACHAEESDSTAALSSAASTAGSSGTALSPANLPGLVLWLDADRGVVKDTQGNVLFWRDQSGVNNDAYQNHADYRPALLPKAIGGKPAVSFNGSQTKFVLMTDTASLRFGIGAYTVLAVAKYRGKVSDQVLFSKIDPTDPWAGVSLLLNPQKP